MPSTRFGEKKERGEAQSMAQSESPRRVVGYRQLMKALRRDEVASVLLAANAREDMRKEILAQAVRRGLPVQEVPTMRELGALCGIAVGSAAAGLLREHPEDSSVSTDA